MRMRIPKATVVFRCEYCAAELVHDGAIAPDRGPKDWALLVPLNVETSSAGRFGAPGATVLICDECRPSKKVRPLRR